LQDLAGRALLDLLEDRHDIALQTAEHTYLETVTSYFCRRYTHNAYSGRVAY
ncbi:MAG TPA: hypothetical protein HA326_04910, partial [Thermoplasmata archaeon]|nr:hypothetical protein [Thermoplasmata archaeon]